MGGFVAQLFFRQLANGRWQRWEHRNSQPTAEAAVVRDGIPGYPRLSALCQKGPGCWDRCVSTCQVHYGLPYATCDRECHAAVTVRFAVLRSTFARSCCCVLTLKLVEAKA